MKFQKPKNMHNGNVIIQLDEPQKQSPNGILIPEGAQEKPSSGVVIFGPEQLLKRRVFFPNYIGTELAVGLKRITEKDIWWDEENL